MERIPNIHPGEILLEEFLRPLGISRHRLAMEISVPANRIGEIVRGKRRISADTALRLGRYFNTTPEFWLNLQMHFDLEAAEQNLGRALSRIEPVIDSDSASDIIAV